MLQTTLPDFEKQEFSVVRQHEEFVWLHDRFEENEEYAGFIVSLKFRHHE
jgi:sorting nexin-5/6/32